MHTQKIVITGVNGFVGKHLVKELRSSGITVVGIDRAESADELIKSELESYYSADLATAWPHILGVDSIIHLAGLAAVGPSFEQPQEYLNINSAILTNLAEFYLTQEKKPRIVVISSGAIYDPKQTMPLSEESKIGYNSPYALSKVLNENQCAYYRERGLDCVVARPFNHIGPGQKAGFLLPDLCEQLVTTQEGGEISVGNITTKRDYTDVRDVVRAYRLLATAENLNHSIYNVCSGASHAGEEILAQLKKLLNKESVEVVVDASRVRPNDPLDIFGSNQRLQTDTGWRPQTTLEQTIKDFVESN